VEVPAATDAFDVIEHDGEDMRNRRFLDRNNALARLLRSIEAGILFNKHIAEALSSPRTLAGLAPRALSKKVDGTYRSGPCRVWIKVHNPASLAM
jgi:ATP-dependent DNA ligase